MGAIFGTPDTGPSEQELRRKRIEQAQMRADSLRSAALQNNETGIVQLFGPGNPSLNTFQDRGENGSQ